MPAAYDKYDYPSYWEGRDYEHLSEIIALRELLNNIPKINTIIDIGAGYGRLSSEYVYRAKKAVLSDPSLKLLALARKRFKNKKVVFSHSKLENLQNIYKNKKFDVAVMIRVIHHIENLDHAFLSLNKLLKDRGYLILEFANKRHFKATVCEICKGNLTFPIDIFPKDIRCRKNIKKKTLPFINYHPDNIIKILNNHNFEILQKRSVSNFRSSFLKRLLPMEFLLNLEKNLQIPFGKINFGPSIFVLARKRSPS
jgi:ubiquinone/menaquinone biosynthesis C-methylase UbiE